MNQDWTFDDLLRQGLLLAAAKDAEDLDRNAEVKFSPQYQMFRKKFLKDPFRYARRKKRPVWKKILKTAACLLLAVALGFAALLAVSPEARAGLMQWVRTIGDTGDSYDFFAEPTDQVPPHYKIVALPEGYSIIHNIATPKSRSVIYRNEEGQHLFFQYMYMEKGIGLGIDTRGAEILDIEVNGCKGHFYYFPDGSNSNAVIWVDEDAGILFDLDMWAGKEEILRIAESVFLTD